MQVTRFNCGLDIVVSGYIRDMEKILQIENHDNSILSNVPQLVTNLCILYYIDEYWYKCGPNVSISNEKQTVQRQSGGGYESCYGNICINGDVKNKNIYKWRIKIGNNPYSNRISVGIADANCRMIHRCVHWNPQNDTADKDLFYCYYCKGDMRSFYGNTRLNVSYDTHDVISIILNMNENTLYFLKGNQKIPHIYTIQRGKDKFYRLCTGLCDSAGVTLLNFQLIPKLY